MRSPTAAASPSTAALTSAFRPSSPNKPRATSASVAKVWCVHANKSLTKRAGSVVLVASPAAPRSARVSLRRATQSARRDAPQASRQAA